MAIVYQYNNKHEYLGTCKDYGGPMPHNCTAVAPPPLPWDHVWPVWNGSSWDMVEDHREHLTTGPDGSIIVQEATVYWRQYDTYQSPPKVVDTIGPIPAGASLTRPVKPFSIKQEEAIRRIDMDTNQKILAGFQHELDGVPYLFHFDECDQINFTATVTKCLLGQVDIITWYGYTIPGGLRVELFLTPDVFYPLFLSGQAHKDICLKTGNERKTQIQELSVGTDAAVVEQLLNSWGL